MADDPENFENEFDTEKFSPSSGPSGLGAAFTGGGGSRPKIEIRVGEMQRAVDEAEAALIVAQPSSPVEKKVFRRATGSSRWRPTKGPTTRAEQSRARLSSSSETIPSPSASRSQRPSRNGTAA